jgi:hypothetical protein
MHSWIERLIPLSLKFSIVHTTQKPTEVGPSDSLSQPKHFNISLSPFDDSHRLQTSSYDSLRSELSKGDAAMQFQAFTVAASYSYIRIVRSMR